MDKQGQPQISPTPSDEEAAALLAALHAHLAAARAAAPTPAQRTPIWASAGRLASQGAVLTYAYGARAGWARN